MHITIRLTKNYGLEAIYPVDETAKTLLSLTGKKTFSRNDLKKIESLGYEIRIQQETL